MFLKESLGLLSSWKEFQPRNWQRMIPGERGPPASLWSRLIGNILKLEPTSSGLMLRVVVAQTPPPSPPLPTTTSPSLHLFLSLLSL